MHFNKLVCKEIVICIQFQVCIVQGQNRYPTNLFSDYLRISQT